MEQKYFGFADYEDMCREFSIDTPKPKGFPKDSQMRRREPFNLCATGADLLRATLPSQVVRVVRDDTSRPMATYWWRFVGGELQWSYEQRDWHRLAADNGFSLTVERVRLLADLMANPTETVEVQHV